MPLKKAEGKVGSSAGAGRGLGTQAERGAPQEPDQLQMRKPDTQRRAGPLSSRVPHTIGVVGGPGPARHSSDKVFRPLPAPQQDFPRNARYRANYLPGRGDLAHLSAEVGRMPAKLSLPSLGEASRAQRTLPAPDKNSIRVAVDISQKLLPISGGREVIRVRLRSTDHGPVVRGPLRLHLVLDRSGSMKGMPWQQVCAAVRDLATRLGPQDRLSVVLYSDTASVLAAPQPGGPGLRQVAEQVCQARTRGETNTFDGLALGYAQARASYDPAATNRVLLVSDGMPTIGPNDPYTLTLETARALGEGITTSALGVGRDFDALLMDRVALEGGGNHHFVRDAAALPAVLTDEIEVLSQQAAEAVDVRIRLPRDVQLLEVVGSEPLTAAESLRVRQVEVAGDQRLQRDQGIAADRQRDVEGGVRFLLPTFRAGDEHAFVLVVLVPPGSGQHEVARVEVRYKDTIAGRNASFVGGRAVSMGANPESAEASADHEVLLAEARARASYALQLASEYLDAANLDGIRRNLYSAAMQLQRAADGSGNAVAHTDADRLRGLADGLSLAVGAGQRAWMVSVLHYYWRTSGVTVWQG